MRRRWPNYTSDGNSGGTYLMANDYALRCQDEPVLLARFRDEADAGGPVEVLTRSWNFEGEVAAVASLPPVYAELLAIGDARCLETANLLHERIIDRFGGWKGAGWLAPSAQTTMLSTSTLLGTRCWRSKSSTSSAPSRTRPAPKPVRLISRTEPPFFPLQCVVSNVT